MPSQFFSVRLLKNSPRKKYIYLIIIVKFHIEISADQPTKTAGRYGSQYHTLQSMYERIIILNIVSHQMLVRPVKPEGFFKIEFSASFHFFSIETHSLQTAYYSKFKNLRTSYVGWATGRALKRIEHCHFSPAVVALQCPFSCSQE